MHAVILAAGEGSRMGPHTDDVPKAFMDLAGRTLYDRQRAVLADRVDDVTVTLGYAAENVRDRLDSANTIVLEDWDEYENAESLRRALRLIDDDVLVMNGDVVVADSVLERLLEAFRSGSAGRNAVAAIPGHQEGSTAVRCDDRDVVTDYGMIRGHRHAGLGIVHRAHVDAAERFLRDHGDDWYPVVYPEFETEMVAIDEGKHVEINRPEDVLATEMVAIDEGNHVEINRPEDVLAARRKFSNMATGEADA